MDQNSPPTHEQLLTLAHKAHGAAIDGDRGRLEASALRLFEALTEHVGAEQPALVHVAPADARLLARGQQRLVDLVVDLTVSAEVGGPCRCDRIADTLLAELTLQADDERRYRVTAAASS